MRAEWLQKIEAAGVVGAGGAGFPSHIKFGAKAEWVLVNAAECEPLLQVDQQLMVYETERFLKGLEAVVAITESRCGVIALKRKYTAAVEALERFLPAYPHFSLHFLDNVYPAGDEHHIVLEVTGKVVPEGGIPLDVGAVVANVETLVNVAKALEGQPVTEKYVTIAGAVRSPSTFCVPVGTSLETLIEKAGGLTAPDCVLIDGGPMMGGVVAISDAVVEKTSKGFIALPKTHPLVVSKEKAVSQIIKDAKVACCHCDLCTDLCPRYLEGHRLHPSRLMRIASYQSTGDRHTTLEEAYLCCECGLCEQACVMNLQPWKLNRFLKETLRKEGVKPTLREPAPTPHPFRTLRGYDAKRLLYRLGLFEYSGDAPLERSRLEVSEVTLMASQHIGAPGHPVVQKGAPIATGDLVFAAAKGVSANIHSSIAGVVKAVSGDRVVVEKIVEEA